jgi:hypothetical protein
MLRRLIAIGLPLLACSFALAIGLPARADVTLVEQGQARCRIHAPAAAMADDDPNIDPNSTLARDRELARQRLRESVRDLVLYLEKMSGAKIEVVTDPPAAAPDLLPILVGDFATTAFGPPAQAAPYAQGFRVIVGPGGVGLAGESDLAASYAIYEVLHALGCRWYMPGELGEVIPSLPTVTLAEMDVSSAPFTYYRGLWYCDDAYRRRNRLGGLLLNAGHALEGYVTAEQRQAHPEWVGEVAGQPSPNRLKWSDPAVAEAIAARLLEYHAANPALTYSLSPDDGLGFDESAADRAIDAGDYDSTFDGISITDRLMVLCNRIAERVTTQEPDVLFGMLAYANYTRPPVREPVHPAIVPQIAPITYSRAHPMTDDRVPGNPELRYLVEGWGQKARATSVYFYGWFLAEPSAPNPMITKWGTDAPIVLANNCRFWQPETLSNFETSMHALYLGSRLAWDPKQEPAQIIDELHQKFYGHAAQEMAAYWHYIDRVWVETPEYSGCGFGYLRRWTPEHLAESRRLLDAGKAACQTDIERRRVQLADDSLALFEQFMKLRRDLAEGRFDRLAEEAAAWRTRVVALGDQWQENYTFTKVPWSAATVNGAYFGSFYQLTYDDATRIARDFSLVTGPLRVWRWQPDKEKTGETEGWAAADYDDAAWPTTDVCLETWSTLGHHNYFGSMWYRSDVSLPEAAGKRTHLWVGATDGRVKLFVNGRHVPYQPAEGAAQDAFEGYCQPISFDVTDYVQAGENQVALLATRTFFNELGTGGLLAPVVVYREK